MARMVWMDTELRLHATRALCRAPMATAAAAADDADLTEVAASRM